MPTSVSISMHRAVRCGGIGWRSIWQHPSIQRLDGVQLRTKWLVNSQLAI